MIDRVAGQMRKTSRSRSRSKTVYLTSKAAVSILALAVAATSASAFTYSDWLKTSTAFKSGFVLGIRVHYRSFLQVTKMMHSRLGIRNVFKKTKSIQRLDWR